uniref:Collagen alpha-1(I) chain-like n=1 Tax=Petromyzon marinus TaxID=7757 RepID=A0AAJ7WXE8_PETMA|nr:collagen alpha-1(I) chain-like [Petromyzon marinus]XP_032813636.1 collagen alpha-1(I) chain-like [Petromyzon marinus]XP_032813637.1 collagen alpha-1(I) chain-like [Petromyzon marinus]
MGAKMSKKRKGRGDADEAKSQTEQTEQAGNAEGAGEETGSQDAVEAGGPDENAASEAADAATGGGAVAAEADEGPRRAAQTAAESPSEDADPGAGAEGEAAPPEVDPEARSTQTERAGDAAAERAAAADTAAAKELGALPGHESEKRAGAASGLPAESASSEQKPGSGRPASDVGSHRSGQAAEGCRPNPGEAAAAAAESPESCVGDTGHGAATRAPGKEGAAIAAGSPPGVETQPQRAGRAVSPGPGKPPQIAPSSSSGSDAGTFAVKLESNAERVEKEEVWVRRDAVESTHAAEKPKRNSHHDGGDSTAPEPDPIIPVAAEAITMAKEPTPPQGVTESQGRGFEDKRSSAVAAKTPTAIAAPSTKCHAETDSVRGSEIASALEVGEKATSPRANDCAQTAAAQLATQGTGDEVAAKPGPRGSAPQATDGVAVSPGTPDGVGALAVTGEGVPASPGSRGGEQQPPPAAPRVNDRGGSGQAPAAAGAVADSSTDAARTNGALDQGVDDDDVGSAGAAAVSGGASAGGGAAAAADAGGGGGDTNGHHRCDDVNGDGTASANDDGGGVRGEGGAVAPAQEAKAVDETHCQTSPQGDQVVVDGHPKAPSRRKGNRGGGGGGEDVEDAEVEEVVGGDGVATAGNLIEF